MIFLFETDYCSFQTVGMKISWIERFSICDPKRDLMTLWELRKVSTLVRLCSPCSLTSFENSLLEDFLFIYPLPDDKF